MKKTLFIALFASFITFSPAFAQNNVEETSKGGIFDVNLGKKTSLSDEKSFTETHPILRMTPDKSEIIKLDRDAVSVVVGNPAHLSVLMDTPRVLVLVPRSPGATHFTVLDRQGAPIMARHAIIAAPSKQYVRVRRSCAAVPEGAECAAQSVYFCPDMCHEIGVTQLGAAASGTEAELPAEVPIGPSPEDIPLESLQE